jgi:hypothetical protein
MIGPMADATKHLVQFEEYAPNRAMLDRLGSAVGSRVAGADANFYLTRFPSLR